MGRRCQNPLPIGLTQLDERVLQRKRGFRQHIQTVPLAKGFIEQRQLGETQQGAVPRSRAKHVQYRGHGACTRGRAIPASSPQGPRPECAAWGRSWLHRACRQAQAAVACAQVGTVLACAHMHVCAPLGFLSAPKTPSAWIAKPLCFYCRGSLSVYTIQRTLHPACIILSLELHIQWALPILKGIRASRVCVY